jgi:hypothetical protein
MTSKELIKKAKLWIKLNPDKIENRHLLTRTPSFAVNYLTICGFDNIKGTCKLAGECMHITLDRKYLTSIGGLQQSCWAFLDAKDIIKEYKLDKKNDK